MKKLSKCIMLKCTKPKGSRGDLVDRYESPSITMQLSTMIYFYASVSGMPSSKEKLSSVQNDGKGISSSY